MPTYRKAPGKLTRMMPSRRDVEVSYIRDPGALRVEDPTTGLWQGRMITPDIISPETLRYAASRSQVFNTILHGSMRDVARFGRRPMFDGDVGFEVVPKIRSHHMTETEQKEARRIEDFLLKTGRTYNPRREDTMREALAKLVYDTLVYDRMALEVVWGPGSPLEYFVLDGANIIKTNPDLYAPQTDRGRAVGPISYIQLHKDQLWAEFNRSELIFGIRNPIPALMNNGYGMPELMELMEPITLEILILTYIDRLLTQGSIPKGLLILKSPRGGQQIESLAMASGQSQEDLARLVRNQIAGAQNAGRLAVLRLRGGEDAELVVNNDATEQMPFIQTYEVVQNQIARKMGWDPVEVGIVTGSIKQSFADTDAKPSRMRQSRSRSNTNLLYVIGDTIYNPLIDFLNPDFCIVWRGIDSQLEIERLQVEHMQMGMGLLTLNQVIAQQNGQKYPSGEKHWWADVPLHPLIFQAEAAKRGLKISGASKVSGVGGAQAEGERGAMGGRA